MLSEADLRRLTAGRWLVPLLAHVEAAQGSRFAVMLAALGVSRSALAAALAELLEAGWLVRNPGHGHPLRPEYLLSEAGAPVAAVCAAMMARRRRLGLDPADLPRWSLPIAARLTVAPSRFSALHAMLEPVTPRALSLTLKQMIGADLVDRAVEPAFPPAPLYGLTARGRLLAEPIRDALAA